MEGSQRGDLRLMGELVQTVTRDVNMNNSAPHPYNLSSIGRSRDCEIEKLFLHIDIPTREHIPICECKICQSFLRSTLIYSRRELVA